MEAVDWKEGCHVARMAGKDQYYVNIQVKIKSLLNQFLFNIRPIAYTHEKYGTLFMYLTNLKLIIMGSQMAVLYTTSYSQ